MPLSIRTLRFIFAILVVGLVSAAALVPVAAQTGVATILGQVTDDGGGALPGVLVTVRSPALQVPEVSTVTDERGEYRITPLPIGTYSVEFALAGFQTVRLPDMRLTTGFIAKMDQILKIGQL